VWFPVVGARRSAAGGAAPCDGGGGGRYNALGAVKVHGGAAGFTPYASPAGASPTRLRWWWPAAVSAVACGCDDGGAHGIILCLAKLKVDMSSSLRWSPPWELASICRPPSGPAGSGHAGCPTGFLVGLQGQQTPCFACWCAGSLTKV